MLLNKQYLWDKATLLHMDSSESRTTTYIKNKTIFYQKSNSYDVFLSHSYLDKSLVYTIVELFNNAGYSVYVDWMIDTQLDRSSVTPGTAMALRSRMDKCYGLAYIATNNISNSKWCPWELGYMDGKKKGRCAILPVVENSTDGFKGQEYLGIYPFIDYRIGEFWVNDSVFESKYVRLRDWLQGTDPYNH